jgi:hypothetical protein
VPREERTEVPQTAGVTVRGNRLVVTDWNAWFAHAPAAIDRALAAGATDATEVLAHVMRAALPKYPWPPAPDSPMRRQWGLMVGVVARTIGLKTSPEDGEQTAVRRLRAVR